MNRKNGFTLFEMLVVVSIIGILLGLISTSFSAAQKRARDSRRIQDINNVQKAFEQYFSLCGAYPYSAIAGQAVAQSSPYGTEAVPLIPDTRTLTCATANNTVILPRYPEDPYYTANANYYYSSTIPGAPGSYNTPTSYCLCAQLEVPGTMATNSRADCSTTGTNIYYCVRNAQ